MIRIRLVAIILCTSSLYACATSHGDEAPHTDGGILWAAYAAEYQAISKQVYAQATRDLPRFIADESWSAFPDHGDLTGQPPAVILDIDETVTSGVDMELTGVPFSTLRQYKWNRSHKATPLAGVVEFVKAAQSHGVEVFFVTNRPCEPVEGEDGFCVQEQVSVDDLLEIGIDTDAEHVLLANEQADWDREKVTRRQFIDKTHRIIMLFGDDFGDFVACSRATPKLPCTNVATRASRLKDLDNYRDYWGNGWYVLPNPMYGSWTSVK